MTSAAAEHFTATFDAIDARGGFALGRRHTGHLTARDATFFVGVIARRRLSADEYGSNNGEAIAEKTGRYRQIRFWLSDLPRCGAKSAAPPMLRRALHHFSDILATLDSLDESFEDIRIFHHRFPKMRRHVAPAQTAPPLLPRELTPPHRPHGRHVNISLARGGALFIARCIEATASIAQARREKSISMVNRR